MSTDTDHAEALNLARIAVAAADDGDSPMLPSWTNLARCFLALADREAVTARPVPEGECPKHYATRRLGSRLFCADALIDATPLADERCEEAEVIANCKAHRNAVAADAYPELIARIMALEAALAEVKS